MKDIEKQQKISTLLFVVVTTIFFIALCTGCSTTVPVTANFPDMPVKLLEKCPTLQKVTEDAKLSDISKTVTVNYTTYYECAVKHDAFIDWYQVQKNIYESIR